MSQAYNVILPRAQARQNQAQWRRNQNTVAFKIGPQMGPVTHTVIITIMLAVLGMIYLTQITKTSTYGYQINELTAKQEVLLDENRDLEVEAARLQALERVQQSNVAKNMESPKATDYASTN